MDFHVTMDWKLVHAFSQAILMEDFREVMSYLKVLFADPDQSAMAKSI